MRYDVIHFWARPYLVPPLFTAFTTHFPADLALLKSAGKKISYQSDGCYVMVKPSSWKAQVDATICHVCQTTQPDTYGFCSNTNTVRLNAAMDRYADIRFGTAMGLDYEKNAEHVFFPVDPELWHEGLQAPPEYVYQRQRPGSLLIYHGVGSHVIGNRGNIKGTVWIAETIRELQNEGHNVEMMHIERVPNKVVRFYQAQADIVVDQLLVGGGGQNSRECLALGKPVLTRMHPQQFDVFKRSSAPFNPPPYIAVERDTLKAELLRLIKSPELRNEVGRKSAQFARDVLSPVFAARRYVSHFERLYPSA
jgi:hypothetical protein